MAQSFQEDTLYKNLITDAQKREKALPIFFESYTRMYPEGDFLCSSQKLEVIAFIFRADKKISDLQKMNGRLSGAVGMLRLLRYLNFSEFIYFIKGICSHSSAWMSEYIPEPHIHLDLVVVQPCYRGKQYGKKMVQLVLKEAREKNLRVSLETQNPTNVAFYKALGFYVINEQPDERMIQYNMVSESVSKQ